MQRLLPRGAGAAGHRGHGKGRRGSRCDAGEVPLLAVRAAPKSNRRPERWTQIYGKWDINNNNNGIINNGKWELTMKLMGHGILIAMGCFKNGISMGIGNKNIKITINGFNNSWNTGISMGYVKERTDVLDVPENGVYKP